MADAVRVENFPDSGSAERVAYDLCRTIVTHQDGAAKWSKQNVLDTYADCIKVVVARGYKLDELR